MGPSCTRVDQLQHFKYCMFDLLVLKSFYMVCRQSRVDISENILNPITAQVLSRLPKYSHPHSASHSPVPHKRMGAKSQIPESLSISYINEREINREYHNRYF